MKYILTSFVFFTILSISIAQQNLEIGATGGISYYRGDINENNFETPLMRGNIGGFMLFNLRPQIIFKGQISIGKLAGDDKFTKNYTSRGAYFDATYYSFLFATQYLPLRKSRYSRGAFQGSWSPYITAGVEYLRFVDKVQCRFCTDPLPEVGDKNSFITIPLGLGARFDYHSKFSFGTELIWHPTFSDSLDGISLLGNANNKDWLITANIFVSYFFGEISPDLNFNMN